ncbi:MAG: cupin [Oscillospiraceae bacterium]|nr:cupin [Oscillospiraceae bacterium]
MKTAFAAFDHGALRLPEREKDFGSVPWSPHPAFQGVELKHLLTGADTGGRFSYHLVRIAPDCAIGDHIHQTQWETHEVVAGTGTCVNGGAALGYEPGVISWFPAGVSHAVYAGADGLRLLAKFFPPLC